MPRYKYFDDEKEIIEGMWAATGRAYYNPKTDTNWCHLPMEMRLECIKRMNFETRMALKRTAKTENLLVKSTRYHFKNFYLNASIVFQTLHAPCENARDAFYRRLEKDCITFLKLAVNILEHCEIDTLNFWTIGFDDEELESICAALPRNAPFRFKTFESNSKSSQINQFFLQNCQGVENVLVNTNRYGCLIVELIDYPSVINAKLVQISFLKDMEQPKALFQLIQKWIENDAEIGKELRFALNEHYDAEEPIELFASIFKDRVISKDQTDIRIRTDNPSKHMILRCDTSYWTATYFSCIIISSDLKEVPEDWKWIEKVQYDEFDDDDY